MNSTRLVRVSQAIRQNEGKFRQFHTDWIKLPTMHSNTLGSLLQNLCIPVYNIGMIRQDFKK